jgi:nucleoside-diphosphate-sugar epimerase
MPYERKNVLVTGGAGFIGSNLAVRLADEGARVTVIDPLITGCGGNEFNLSAARAPVELVRKSIGDTDAIEAWIRAADVIFNLAGEISHIHSMLLPERDLDINTLSQLRFVQACVRWRPGVRIIYAGTRQVYGVPERLPVDESHPVSPVDFNGVHKYAATQYHLMLSRTGHLDAAVIRFTNVYGPRMALDVPCQGFLPAYLRRVLTGQTLKIYGDGLQLRDPLFVDDAVEAMCIAGSVPQLPSRAYNVGGPEALTLAGIAEMISRLAGVAKPVFREFPPDRKAIDIGSYRTDWSRSERELGWRPRVGFEEGIAATLAYYRVNLAAYLDVSRPNPPCKLGHQ